MRRMKRLQFRLRKLGQAAPRERNVATKSRIQGGSAPELSLVVLSYKGRATLLQAVKSACEQDIDVEVVVVHSGGGDIANQLQAAGIDVRVVEVAGRLYAGGARNCGIEATRGRFVAFLADDCVAKPDWARERLNAHRGGAVSVASALECHRPKHPIALAAHLSLFTRRMPRIAKSEALAYGASYDRRLFDRYGMFREDLKGGEDTEFHRRLPPSDKPVWCPNVRTVHIGTETLWRFLSDQFVRGRRSVDAWRGIGTHGRKAVAKAAIVRSRFLVGNALRVVEPKYRWAAALAIPFILLGSIVYATGALTKGNRRNLPQLEKPERSG